MEVHRLKVAPVCCCCCCCGWSIFTVVAILMSFTSLEQGFFALELNWLSQEIGREVASEPGLKWVGLGNMLLEFPSTFQTMYFVADGKGTGGDEGGVKRGPINTRSRDGLEMRVSVSFLWKLESSNLHELYSILGDHLYEDEFVRFARSAVVQSCANFTADTFFTNRTQITNAMLDNMIAAFDKPEQSLKVAIKGLQLREVDLPDEFDEEIGRTQEQMQEVEVATAERLEMQIAMDRKIIETVEKVNKMVIDATADADALLNIAEASVQQQILWQRKQAQGNAAILKIFKDDPDAYQQLFEVMETWAMHEHDLKKLVVDM